MATANRMIEHVEKGMDVYDSTGNHLGTVDALQYGNPTAATTKGQGSPMDENLMTEVARALATAEAGSEEIPEELEARFKRHGYLRIDSGILESDAYVMGDQINNINGDDVHLSVSKDSLLHR